MSRLLSHYNPATENWDLEKEGAFWDAVKRAHELGFRGAGRRVAVIDSCCDYSFPQIQRQTGGKPKLSGLHGEPTDHGTLVALLVGAVAPECDIDAYEISRNGEPDINAVEKAIYITAESNADIICLSLGSPAEISIKDEYAEALNRKDVLNYLKMAIKAGGDIIKKEIPACSLCRAASQAVSKGKMVFAAVGNDKGAVFCPAIHPDVVAVGFQLESRSVVDADLGGQREIAMAEFPGFSQSVFSDFSMIQLQGALGSSFACPLLAGAAALGLEREELPDFLTSWRITGIADALLPALSPQSPPEFVALIGDAYREAFYRHPHQHITPEKSAGCVECSIFSLQLYTNGGLYYLYTGRYDEAERYFRVARWFAPWSADAAANLGRTLQVRADNAYLGSGADFGDVTQIGDLYDEAAKHYRDALAIRPGFPPYQKQLEEINNRRGSMF
ncbi:MAG: hypothetical protein JXB26_00745 [Candidatus Aminicenantes bacterium]|nr:hypothetical protein [Candidatus Aminicenantes bacterium]